MKYGALAVCFYAFLLLLISTLSAAGLKQQYIREKSFAENVGEFSFSDVTDIAINSLMGHVLVLQRSYPPVTAWTTEGRFLFSWDNTNIGYPHSITLNGSDPESATIWITDMAGTLAAGKDMYGHCIKQFTYYGKLIGTIGKCGKYSNGSSLDPTDSV